jgi:hypothetical protein
LFTAVEPVDLRERSDALAASVQPLFQQDPRTVRLEVGPAAVLSGIGHVRRDDPRVNTALKARGRALPPFGSEAYGREQTPILEENPRTERTPTAQARPFTASWERERLERSIKDRTGPTCGKDKGRIAHQRPEVLAVEPAPLSVKPYGREGRAWPGEPDGVVVAPTAPRLVGRSRRDLSRSIGVLERDLALAGTAPVLRTWAAAPQRTLITHDATAILALDKDQAGGRTHGRGVGRACCLGGRPNQPERPAADGPTPSHAPAAPLVRS